MGGIDDPIIGVQRKSVTQFQVLVWKDGEEGGTGKAKGRDIKEKGRSMLGIERVVKQSVLRPYGARFSAIAYREGRLPTQPLDYCAMWSGYCGFSQTCIYTKTWLNMVREGETGIRIYLFLASFPLHVLRNSDCSPLSLAVKRLFLLSGS